MHRLGNLGRCGERMWILVPSNTLANRQLVACIRVAVAWHLCDTCLATRQNPKLSRTLRVAGEKKSWWTQGRIFFSFWRKTKTHLLSLKGNWKTPDYNQKQVCHWTSEKVILVVASAFQLQTLATAVAASSDSPASLKLLLAQLTSWMQNVRFQATNCTERLHKAI